MGTAMKHPVPDRVKPSFVIFDIRALWRSERVKAVLRLQWVRCLFIILPTLAVRGTVAAAPPPFRP